MGYQLSHIFEIVFPPPPPRLWLLLTLSMGPQTTRTQDVTQEAALTYTSTPPATGASTRTSEIKDIPTSLRPPLHSAALNAVLAVPAELRASYK
ncbi:unnamed protein product [Clonostachys solani]|uniref:Uncharacterized protein n=1 Tax=Clonostachys solani TaxID=160281 RepID=A0A9N9W0N1_9HYPO|nr:unnamed protein product [Clonostachys solani]